ncbi:DUF3473 domain-containing protein [bacterium]|nr:DUF3473 domain-containing protein [bacterium]
MQVNNILTIDVEEWFQCYNIEGCIARDDWDNIPSRLAVGVDKFLDILNESNTKATCFILGYIAVRHPKIIRKIAERGHEIACHGWDHKLITRQSPDEFQRETEDSVKAITDITGKEVKGYRASNFTIVKDTLWALKILAEIGFQYDSSIFPFKRSRYGITAFPRNPIRINLNSDLEIIEFPLPTMKIFGKSLPAGGGGYLRFYPYGITKWAINELNKGGIPATVYIHPWELDPDQPRVKKGIDLKKRMMHYCRLSSTETKLRSLLRDFRFTTIENVYNSIKNNCDSLDIEGVGK